MRSLLPLALAAIALALAACGNESDKTFDQDGFPFKFEYPHAFEEVNDVNFDSSLGASADQTAAIGIGDDDLILVQRFTLNRAIDRSELRAAKRQFDDLFRQIDPTVSAQASKVAGLPALTIDAVDVAVGRGRPEPLSSRSSTAIRSTCSTASRRRTTAPRSSRPATWRWKRSSLDGPPRPERRPSRAHRLSASMVPSPSGSASGGSSPPRSVPAISSSAFFSAGTKPDFMPK